MAFLYLTTNLCLWCLLKGASWLYEAMRPYFAPKKLPVIGSKQGKKQLPGSTGTFTSVK